MEDQFATLLKRLEAVTTKLETMPSGGAPSAPAAGGGGAPAVDVSDDVPSPMVDAFDAFLSGAVAAYVSCAEAISMPEVTEA
jgi:hypothetical protein